MPSEHAGRLVREPRANTGRDADMPSLPCRTDRYYSAEGPGRAGRSRGRGSSWSTRDNAGIARRWHSYNGMPLMITYHPAYLLRNQSPSEKRKVWEDMMQVLERLEKPINEKQRNYFL